MNHMDENYWKNLAQSWIQSKQQTQQQIEIPAAPNINNSDNHAIADMDIEDIKEDEPEKLWNWQNSNFQIQQPHQQLPVVHNFPVVNHQPPSQSYNHFANKQIPLIIPEAPIIKTSYVHSDDGGSNNLVDMDMADSENEDDDSNSTSSGMMDARKRKMLPIWIREGLEKMKREKEMEIQRQQEEIKLKEEEAKRKKLMEEALLELEREKTVKSKYDSASSDDEEDDDSKRQKTDKKVVQNSIVPSEPIVEEVDDEEAYENMMLLVRKTLTSILLEVTNELIHQISTETLSKYRKKASATQSKTPALIGLGLGVYSSSSDDDSDNDEKNRSDQSDWEPESLLKERIRQKAITFEKRSKDVEDKLAKIAELEDIKYKRKKDSHELNSKSNRNDHEEQKSKSNSNNGKDGGEEKYETKVSSSALLRSREKRTRFSDPKEGRSVTMTHVNVMQEPLRPDKGGIVPISLSSIYPTPPTIRGISPDKLEKMKKSKRRDSSTSSTSGSSSHRKKHKKHKKSSKHSKKSSKKRDRSRSRSKSRDKTHHKSDRRSIESKSSVRSTESRSRHSRSRSRDRRNRRRY